MGDHIDALEAIVDIREAARLKAISPNSDAAGASIERVDDLATDGRRRLFPTAVPRPEWTVDIVKPRDERLHAALMRVLLAEHFADQLLPAVSPFRHCGIRVRFPERANVWISLQQRVVDTCRTCKEISLRAGLVRGLEHVRINQDASQTFNPESLDKAH